MRPAMCRTSTPLQPQALPGVGWQAFAFSRAHFVCAAPAGATRSHTPCSSARQSNKRHIRLARRSDTKRPSTILSTESVDNDATLKRHPDEPVRTETGRQWRREFCGPPIAAVSATTTTSVGATWPIGQGGYLSDVRHELEISPRHAVSVLATRAPREDVFAGTSLRRFLRLVRRAKWACLAKTARAPAALIDVRTADERELFGARPRRCTNRSLSCSVFVARCLALSARPFPPAI